MAHCPLALFQQRNEKPEGAEQYVQTILVKVLDLRTVVSAVATAQRAQVVRLP